MDYRKQKDSHFSSISFMSYKLNLKPPYRMKRGSIRSQGIGYKIPWSCRQWEAKKKKVLRIPFSYYKSITLMWLTVSVWKKNYWVYIKAIKNHSQMTTSKLLQKLWYKSCGCGNTLQKDEVWMGYHYYQQWM